MVVAPPDDKLKASVKAAIELHLERTYEGSRLLADPTLHESGLWRGLVAITPGGPLVIMEFGITYHPEGASVH